MTFRSVHVCLTHAFHAPLAYKGASVEKQYRDKGGMLPSSGLSVHERIAECAMIQHHVDRLPEAERLTVIARYAQSPDNVEATRRLTALLMPKLAGITHRHMVHLLALQILGARIWVENDVNMYKVLLDVCSGRGPVKMHGQAHKAPDGEWRRIEMLPIAQQFKVSRDTVQTKKAIIRPIIDNYRDRADALLLDSLTQAGYVGDSGPRVEIRGPILRRAMA